jgi:hypothetical protein
MDFIRSSSLVRFLMWLRRAWCTADHRQEGPIANLTNIGTGEDVGFHFHIAQHIELIDQIPSKFIFFHRMSIKFTGNTVTFGLAIDRKLVVADARSRTRLSLGSLAVSPVLACGWVVLRTEKAK